MSEVLNQTHSSTGGWDASDLQISFTNSPSLACSDFFPTLILGGPVRMRGLMPKHVDCSQLQHLPLAFTTYNHFRPTPITLYIDVASAHRLRKEDAGIFSRAVICVHPAGNRVVR